MTKPSYHGRDTTSLSVAQLKEYEAVAYEMEMLGDVLRWLVGKPTPTGVLKNVLTESLAVHVRNLEAFLWRTSRFKSKDVLALDFIRSDAVWPPGKPPGLDDLVDRVSTEVAHLTTWRLPGQDPDKDWSPRACLKALVPALEAFVGAADPAKLSPKVAPEAGRLRQLLDDTTPAVMMVISTNLSTSTNRPLGLI
jgi:hypothetical protein